MPPTTQLVFAAIGGLVGVAGLLILARARYHTADTGVGSGLSRSTRSLIGLSIGMLGYHLVAYLGPAGWVTFAVPMSLSWLVGLGLALGVGVSIWLDARTAQEQAAEGASPGEP